jgi:hypothetical protein
MSLDLDETASILTDDVESIYLRAIRLFEFQICLFFPEALSSEKINYWHANARLLAALRFLEHIEITAKDNKEATATVTSSLPLDRAGALVRPCRRYRRRLQSARLTTNR